MQQKSMIQKKTIKWESPKIKTITFQDLKLAVTASACSIYYSDTCLGRNMR